MNPNQEQGIEGMIDISLTENQVIERVNLYLDRIKTMGRNYSPDEVGIWLIYGGFHTSIRDFTPSKTLGKEDYVFRGRFIDVVAHAVQISSFYHEGKGRTAEGMKDRNSGHIVKIEPKEVPRNSDLNHLVE